jgi:hypothetical protein
LRDLVIVLSNVRIRRECSLWLGNTVNYSGQWPRSTSRQCCIMRFKALFPSFWLRMKRK